MTLTDDITYDLARRIRTQQVKPRQLTLVALASEYGVSATPVRQAIQRLIADGLVDRLPNGRLAPVHRRRKTARRPRSSARAAHHLPELVEGEILRRSMRGEHEFLREEAFAELLGVGRTRLRTVLHALAGAGVVEHVERRGWRARPFQRKDMLAYLDVRATLEVQALDLARTRLIDADLEGFLRGNDPDAIARRVIDNGLHAYFVEKSDNQYLAAFFASHGRYYARLFDFAAVDAGRLEEMAGQHTEILMHVCKRRWARARQALRNHIHSQAPVLTAAIERLNSHT